ncbi:MAG: hypothetical protein KC457_25590, partial [Myxococcales bacterium]|nr:hypothetical protein [Myxococcales bacterium]
GEMLPRDLAGSAPDDIWAAAVASCDIIECFGLEDCACKDLQGQVMHFDGVAWTPVEVPLIVQKMWTDGVTTWAAGGRIELANLDPTGGQVARFDGVDWTMLSPADAPPLKALWATGADEAWVGGENGTLRHFSQGIWTSHDQPTDAWIIEIEGRSAVEAWALDDSGQLYAWDGVDWSPWLQVPQARDFTVADDGLILVGEENGHWVGLLDIELAALTTLYTRDGRFWPASMVVDDMSTAVTSAFGTFEPNRRWDGQDWTPTYPQVPLGLASLHGAVDQGWASRHANPDWYVDPAPDDPHLYQIVDGVPLPVELPADNLALATVEPLIIDGQEQLWIGGRTHSGDVDAYIYAREGDVWVDRRPLQLSADAYGTEILTGAEDRVFAAFETFSPGNELWTFAGGEWTSMLAPPFSSLRDMVATGADDVWATGYVNQQVGERLYHWDGLGWEPAADQHPAIADVDDWWTLEALGPDDIWMLTSNFFEPERLAHYDGQDWAMVDTPALLHGWIERQNLLLAPAEDGVFIHDGIRLWRYELCPL